MSNDKRKRIKSEFNESRKIAAVKDMINNPNNKLNKEHLQTLLDKYGPSAYDIVSQCLKEPANILKRADKPFMVSRKAIEYFANTDMTAAEVAKVTGKNVQTVENGMASYKQDKAASAPSQQEAQKKQQKMETRVDEHTDSQNTGLTPTDRQLKAIKSWAKTIGLDPDETAAKLVEKYGSLAYEVMDNSMNKPSVTMRNMGEKPLGSSLAVVEYFLNNDIPAEKLAKGLGVKKSVVAQKLPAERQQRFDNRVDKEQTEQTAEKEQENTQASQAEPEQQAPAEDEHTGEMTLDDYYHCYKPKDRPLTGKALEDAAYKDFGAGEGVVNGIYTEWQDRGNPTLGVGGLIIPQGLCSEPLRKTKKKGEKISPYDQVYGQPDGWLERFKKMPLTDKNGKTLSADEKAKIFEDIRRAVRTKTLKTTKTMPYRIIYPASAANVKMSATAMRNKFNQDFAAKLRLAQLALGKGNLKKGQEIFNKYPKDLQLAIVHAYYAGKPGNAFTEAVAAGKVNVYNPEEVQAKISALRPKKNGKNGSYCASNAERKTIDNAGDSIRTARREYYERQARYAQAKTNQGTVRS